MSIHTCSVWNVTVYIQLIKKIQKSRITSELDRVKKDLPLTLLHSLYLPNKKTLLLYEFDQALRPWVKKEVDI